MLLPCEEGNWPPGCSASLWDKKLTVWMSSLNNVLVNWSFSRWGWISALWNVFRGEFRFPLRTQTQSDLLFTPSLWASVFWKKGLTRWGVGKFFVVAVTLVCFVFWLSFPKIWKSWNHLAPGSTQHPGSTFGVQLSNSWIFSPMFRPQAGKEFNVLQGLLFHRK